MSSPGPVILGEHEWRLGTPTGRHSPCSSGGVCNSLQPFASRPLPSVFFQFHVPRWTRAREEAE